MPIAVTIAAGHYNVELPNGLFYNATNASGGANGPTVYLSDDQGARLNTASAGIASAVEVGTGAVTSQGTAPPTLAAITSTAVATTAPTQTSPYGYTTSAQAAAIVTAVNALVTDVTNLRTELAAEIAALTVSGGPQV